MKIRIALPLCLFVIMENTVSYICSQIFTGLLYADPQIRMNFKSSKLNVIKLKRL